MLEKSCWENKVEEILVWAKPSWGRRCWKKDFGEKTVLEKHGWEMEIDVKKKQCGEKRV